MTPPTWRALAARARAVGIEIAHGRHEASLTAVYGSAGKFESWISATADDTILRTAVAAALEQLEARR